MMMSFLFWIRALRERANNDTRARIKKGGKRRNDAISFFLLNKQQTHKGGTKAKTPNHPRFKNEKNGTYTHKKKKRETQHKPTTELRETRVRLLFFFIFVA
jgi:hypothetical protein